MRKLFCSILVLMISMFSIQVHAQVSPEETVAVSKKEMTLDDLQFEPGKVDLEKLPVELKEKVKNRIKELNKYFEDLSNAKVQYKIQLKESKLNDKNKTKLKDAKDKYDDLYNNANSIAGLTIVEDGQTDQVEEGTITPFATIEDVVVDKPTLFYDNLMRMYVMNGGWDWVFNPDSNPGGDDGFGLKTVQRKVSIFDSSIITYTGNGDVSSHSYSHGAGNYGVGISFQDRSMGITYSGHSGSAWMYFNWYSGVPVGYSVNYRAVYAHSWGSVALNGFSIGENTFGLSWTTGTQKMSKEDFSVVQY